MIAGTIGFVLGALTMWGTVWLIEWVLAPDEPKQPYPFGDL